MFDVIVCLCTPRFFMGRAVGVFRERLCCCVPLQGASDGGTQGPVGFIKEQILQHHGCTQGISWMHWRFFKLDLDDAQSRA